MVYHVYIMASESGVLYIGVTNHLESRTAQRTKTSPGLRVNVQRNEARLL
jgi:predicted GIY-YIG superfamily endonuclease